MEFRNRSGKAESETLEFKASLSQLDRIVETVSAFANTKGGTIVVGLTGKGEIIGTQIGKDTIEKLTKRTQI